MHLLPNYDELVVAYTDHDASFEGTPPRRADAYDVLSRHIIVRDGYVIGGWRTVAGDGSVAIETKLLLPMDRAQQAALRAEAARYSRFIGVPVTVRRAPV
jgi:hypothetical protein